MRVCCLSEGQGMSAYVWVLTVALLKERGGWKILLFFHEDITSCTCVTPLNDIFHWYTQQNIFNKFLLSAEAGTFSQLTIEIRDYH